MTTTTAPSNRRFPLTWPQLIGLVLALAGFALPFIVQFENLSPAGHRMFAIFILAILLWISEAVPMHATAVLIILLEILMLSKQAPGPMISGLDPAGLMNYKDIFASLADPVIILFLGGFFLADTATKFNLDRNLAGMVLKPFGSRPSMVLMGLMLVTALFSMFMSNTATTATMMAVALPVLARFPAGDRMRTAIALSIPIAANIGGIGTPIGTPPNAIALGALSSAKAADPSLTYAIPTFFQWMVGAIPFMLVFLFICWVLLILLFPTKHDHIELDLSAKFDKSRPAIIFYITFAVTVLLWLTESLHGFNSNIVGFVPVVVLLCTRVFTVKDLQALDWHVLWLVAGGIALGLGIGKTGMDRWFISLFPWESMNAKVIVAVLAFAALAMGTFISHSATANLLVPIGIALAKSPEVAISPIAAAIWIAIGSSLAMALPISTPPNAIAFSTGEVRVKDMAIIGTLIGIITWALFVTLGPWFWELVGILPR